MAYEPTEWKSGDVVTSAKLNKLENGVASGGVLVATDTDGTLDKTWQEIHDAALAVIKLSSGDVLFVYSIYIDDGVYTLYEYNPEVATAQYVTNEANGYPVRQEIQ